MSKAGRKKKGDDVLRAGDMVPPYGDEGGVPKKKGGRQKPSASKETGKNRGAKSKPAKAAGAVSKASEIPQLDLDKQILAEQRKVTSGKRRGPGNKSKSPTASAETAAPPSRAALQPGTELAERDPVIAEIVARDIERFCRS